VIIGVLVMILLNWPALLINDRALGPLSKVLRRQGVWLDWKTAHLDATSLSFFRKKIVLYFSGLCVREEVVKGCTEMLSATFIVDLRKGIPEITKIGPVVVEGGELDFVPTSKVGESPSEFAIPELPSWLASASIEMVRVQLKRWKVGAIQGDLELNGAGITEESPWILLVNARAKKWKATLKGQGFIDENEKLQYQLSLSYMASPAKIHVVASGTAGRDKIEAQVDSSGLVASLPQPFASLRGKVMASVQWGAWKKTVPLSVKTRLSSENQRLDIEANGELTPFSHLKMKVALENVRLVLPRLDLKSPPKLVPDPRIRRADESDQPKAREKAASFTYDIEVTTAKPMYFVSNLTKSDIPILTNLRLRSGKPIHGTVRIAKVPLDLFQRKAWLDHFDIKMKSPDSEHSDLDGLIAVSYSDYTINIAVLGTLQEPHVRVSSEPPLPEKQVWAVLLFGKPLEQLDDNQSASIGSARAALADGAISLASMYLLASTPIESIGYDPARKMFSAKIRLSEKTSLQLGSDLREIDKLGLRRRLSPHWALNAYFDNPFDTQRRALTALLEWGLSY